MNRSHRISCEYVMCVCVCVCVCVFLQAVVIPVLLRASMRLPTRSCSNGSNHARERPHTSAQALTTSPAAKRYKEILWHLLFHSLTHTHTHTPIFTLIQWPLSPFSLLSSAFPDPNNALIPSWLVLSSIVRHCVHVSVCVCVHGRSRCQHSC